MVSPHSRWHVKDELGVADDATLESEITKINKTKHWKLTTLPSGRTTSMSYHVLARRLSYQTQNNIEFFIKEGPALATYQSCMGEGQSPYHLLQEIFLIKNIIRNRTHSSTTIPSGPTTMTVFFGACFCHSFHLCDLFVFLQFFLLVCILTFSTFANNLWLDD